MQGRLEWAMLGLFALLCTALVFAVVFGPPDPCTCTKSTVMFVTTGEGSIAMPVCLEKKCPAEMPPEKSP